MTIVAAADYKVTQPQTFQHAEDIRVLSEKWKDSVCAFMKEPQIIVWKKTKRSEKEVDIKPMIYDMHAEDDGIFLFLATGSEQNLKPDLVMKAFLRFIGENPEEVPLHFHRLEVYAKNPKSAGGTTKNDFISLEDLGKDIVTT